MAEPSDESTIEVDPVILLQKVEKQASLNKLLLTIVLVISGIVITVMATGMTVMFLKLSDLTTALNETEEDPMDEQFLALEQQLMLLADFRKSELKKIEAYTKQLEKVSNDCDLEKAAPYREFLLSREKDFQSLLGTIKSGTVNLAGMSKGSRQWLDDYQKQMEELKQLSISRQSKLDELVKKSGVK
jgi:hypothetical protein